MTHDIVIKKNTPPIVPRKQIKCSPGDAQFRCGHCGHKIFFGVHVRPLPLEGTARIVELICPECGFIYKFDDQGRLGGGGRLDSRGKSNGKAKSVSRGAASRSEPVG